MNTQILDQAPLLSTSEVFGQPSREKIAARAYERFQGRGGAHGYDIDDWLDAEREVYDEAQTMVEEGQPPAVLSEES